MVNTYSAYKSLLQCIMRLAGMKPMIVNIEPGTDMNFWVPTKDPKGAKPAVVFLHGFAADGICTWQFQVLALARKYAVYVPDFLFFGNSYTTSSERSPEFQAKCVVKGLRKLGVEKSTLVGFSYGGMVGCKMAEMDHNLVQSVVVSCFVTTLTESITKGCLDRLGCSALSDYLLPKTADGVRALFERASYKLPRMPQWVYKHLLEAMFYNRKEKEELLEACIVRDKDFKVPDFPQKIHFLMGKEDLLINMEVADNMREQLESKATLQYIEKAGHLAHLERPCIYNRNLKQILASLTGKDEQK